jgi:hypothetical protein
MAEGQLTLSVRISVRYYDKVTQLPNSSLAQWLETQKDGLPVSSGSFSLDGWNARRLGGYPSLGLSDAPLLLMAGAVEGGSSFLRLYGRRNCFIEWDGQPGQSYHAALALLARERVDFRSTGQSGLELPELFWDFLGPFYKRCLHAPLNLLCGDRVVGHQTTEIRATRSSQPQLILVDRGVDFELPVAFSGLRIVCPVPKALTGAPWPKRLVWNEELRKHLSSIRPLPGSSQDFL